MNELGHPLVKHSIATHMEAVRIQSSRQRSRVSVFTLLVGGTIVDGDGLDVGRLLGIGEDDDENFSP